MKHRTMYGKCYIENVEPKTKYTEYMWTDRHPYSVCSVEKNWKGKNFDIVVIQRDHAKE